MVECHVSEILFDMVNHFPLQFSKQELSVAPLVFSVQYQKIKVSPLHSFGKIELR